MPHIPYDSVLAWIAIGAGASLAGMIWSFRRGALGIAVNLLAGIAGALLAALASYAFLPVESAGSERARLFYAALGAIAMLGIVHAAWSRRMELRRHAGS